MEAEQKPEIERQNENAYDDLIVSIEAKKQSLSLLIAVCDDMDFRDKIIDRYERELKPDLPTYKVTLSRGEPSLKAAVARLIQTEEYLRQGGQAVITVVGAEKLYFINTSKLSGENRTERDIFFGYLQ
jgi:hypothetical protein